MNTNAAVAIQPRQVLLVVPSNRVAAACYPGESARGAQLGQACNVTQQVTTLLLQMILALKKEMSTGESPDFWRLWSAYYVSSSRCTK